MPLTRDVNFLRPNILTLLAQVNISPKSGGDKFRFTKTGKIFNIEAVNVAGFSD